VVRGFRVTGSKKKEISRCFRYSELVDPLLRFGFRLCDVSRGSSTRLGQSPASCQGRAVTSFFPEPLEDMAV